ncbi:50S ribosomal protein L10 [Patescibacteria group bacterium]|nr:50S ribosomal protein L10 [Patescibacteria group bacterium]
MPTSRKKDTVKNLVEKFQPSQAVVFTDFTGLTAAELSGLRSQLGEHDSYYTITKNTLLEIASQQCGYGKMAQEFTNGPTATLFCFTDAVTSIKIIY